MQSATIKIFLVNGHPNSLRTAEISNWTGKAIACPRSEFDDLLKRSEIKTPGVYFLQGYDEESMPTVYIGEAEDVGKRLKEHRDRDWINVIAFISKDENLTKSHIKYLEGRLIRRFREISNIHVENTQSSGAKLPESETSDMNEFLDKIYQLLPVLGTNYFASIHKTKKSNVLYCKTKNIEAIGIRTNNGFIVFKGSQAVLDTRTSVSPSTVNRRKMLENKKILVKKQDHMVFSKDYEFTSPSVAGSDR